MSKTHLFRVNRSVTSLAGETRQLRLPTARQFPKLNQRFSRSAIVSTPAAVLPEITGDVIDVRAGYAVENVKREAGPARFGLAQWLSRLLGYSHRAARP